MSSRPLVALAILFPAIASADTFKIFGEVAGGGMYGDGTSGAAKSDDFHHESPRGAYGVDIGAELFFVDAWISHHQFTDGDRITTWTKFGLGMHFEVDFAKDPQPAEKGGNGKAANRPDDRKAGGFFEAGIGLFFGLGTGQQVEPPLDNGQITDKALQIEVRPGIGRHLNNVIDIGFQLPVSYGYFIKNGADVVANDLDNHYRGWALEGLVYLRANIRLL